MKYQFSIQNDRVKYLTKELSDKIIIISQDDEWTRLEITIESSLDILLVFHAGCKTGIDAMMPEKYK